ncbi:hypothetical protein ACQKMZ_25345 [Bacillus paramycoides]|uniref:hypothetical protein n=1 Tax=Bacillus paramycoides TaxID=2026194 RepID=UPI003D088777
MNLKEYVVYKGEIQIMVIWLIVGVIIYLTIGIGLIVYVVKTDPSWGGLLLHFAVPLILFWPYFIIRSLSYR